VQVETYEVTELVATDAGVEPESDAEALELIERLGLEGQQSYRADSTDGTVTRIPYRKMTLTERRVFEVLLPQHVELAKYDAGPIPLRVLQVAAHAVEIWDGEHVKVWHPTETRYDDPILVATGEKADDLFLLARWGEVLAPFDAMLVQAREALLIQWRQKIAKKEAEVRTARERIEEEADSWLGGHTINQWDLPEAFRRF